ncbi:MAG: class I SAM-dependent methyltransferase [Turicibacter sp.]|nr:class I SAM-dependent methyltransferase [Turicibacter sp.]
MITFELSRRLKACLEFLSGLDAIADIGTDHALLPCYGILNGKIKKAVAADVGAGPLQMAKTTVDKHGLQGKIDIRLGSGLSVLSPDEVEGVVIAGMGGKLIRSIIGAHLEVARSCHRLVLQSNVDAPLIREILPDWGFSIVDEALILEDGKFYEIIVAEPDANALPYSEEAILFGPVLLENQSDPAFKAYWEVALEKQQLILDRLPKGHPKFETVQKRHGQIREVLGKC